MPKVKTHSGAKKRFKRPHRASSSLQRVFKRHLLTDRSQEAQASAPQRGYVPPAHHHQIEVLLPYTRTRGIAMPRAKRGFKARRRRNRVLKAAKGFRGKRKSCHAIANEAVQHAWMHMYRSRKRPQAGLPRAVDPAHQRGGALRSASATPS